MKSWNSCRMRTEDESSMNDVMTALDPGSRGSNAEANSRLASSQLT